MPVSSPGALDDPIAAAAPIVTGRLALHGGGEFLPGDEAFLDALLGAVRASPGANGMLRAVVVPTAAARGRPDLAASNGVAALERRAAAAGIALSASVARVVDDGSAADAKTAAEIAAADLVYLPGGDPDLIPAILGVVRGRAGDARRVGAGRDDRGRERRGDGARGVDVDAGAAAWRASGTCPGSRSCPTSTRRGAGRGRRAPSGIGPRGVGYLGLDERTGVISSADDGGADWIVAGEGAAHWFALGASTPVVARDGERLSLD